MTEWNKTLVIVDDSPVILGLLKKVVADFNIRTYLTGSYEEAIEYCNTNKVDILITDLNIHNKSGFDLIKAVSQSAENEGIENFIISAESPKPYRPTIRQLNIKGWFLKPLSPKIFRSVVGKIIDS